MDLRMRARNRLQKAKPRRPTRNQQRRKVLRASNLLSRRPGPGFAYVGDACRVELYRLVSFAIRAHVLLYSEALLRRRVEAQLKHPRPASERLE